ncbi:MAG TPA: TlpA disulfide reductase family protein [Longimicrobiaceae bacterium]|nr:TlpA disulfide reductase family protein [Longimicrobiaceae bacterium]
MMKSWLLALLLTAASTGCSVDAGRSIGEVGQPAPDYSAVTLAGDSVSLASLSGEVVLLNVWATWCHPCREEIPVLQQLHEDHADEGLAVIGVSVDARGEEANIREFAEDYGMTYPVWLDPAERVSAIFRLLGVPSTFLIDRNGVIVWKHLGPLPPGDPGLAAAITEAL